MIGGVGARYPARNKHGRLVWVLYYCSWFTLTKSILDLRTFVANSALSRLRAFWGALLAKIWWEGAQKHFIGPRLRGLRKVSIALWHFLIDGFPYHGLKIFETNLKQISFFRPPSRVCTTQKSKLAGRYWHQVWKTYIFLVPECDMHSSVPEAKWFWKFTPKWLTRSWGPEGP